MKSITLSEKDKFAIFTIFYSTLGFICILLAIELFAVTMDLIEIYKLTTGMFYFEMHFWKLFKVNHIIQRYAVCIISIIIILFGHFKFGKKF